MVMDASTAAMQQFLFGQRESSATFDGPQVGLVTKTPPAGPMLVIPDFDSAAEFGPASCLGGKPDVGDTVLVLFVGTGVDNLWIISEAIRISASDVGAVPMPGPWETVTLGSGWSATGGEDSPPGYRLLGDGRVEIRGGLSSAASPAATAFTVPVTPSYVTHQAVPTLTGAARMTITQEGQVQPPTNTSTWIDGIVFDGE